MTLTASIRRAAFTLVEVVVALTIASLLLIMVLRAASETLTIQRASSALDAGTSSSLAVLELLQRDLLCLSRTPTGRWQFIGERAGQGIEMEFLSTTTIAPNNTTDARYNLQLSVLRYTTRMEPDGSLALFRSSRQWANALSMEEPPSVPVARGLSKVEAEFFDGVAWHDQWVERTPPIAMRLGLTRMSSTAAQGRQIVQTLQVGFAQRSNP